MNHTFGRAIALIAISVIVGFSALGSAQSDFTGRWVARVPNGDGTFRETVFVLNQQGSTLTGSVVNPNSEQPIVEGVVDGANFTFASAPPTNPRRLSYRGATAGDELTITV